MPLKYLIAFLLTLFITANFALAQGNCEVSVTIIHGSNSPAKDSDQEVELEHFAPSLKRNMRSLPCSSLKRIRTKTQKVDFGETASFSLRDNSSGVHQVSIRPTQRTSEKIQALVNWTGPDNSTLLSTQMRIVNGQNMVLGAEQGKDSSVILDISLNCLG